jgi:hypothetical protein
VVSAVVLAGGHKPPHGRDKALIDYQGLARLSAHVIDTLRALADDIAAASNRSDADGSFGARVVPDYEPPCGPLEQHEMNEVYLQKTLRWPEDGKHFSAMLDKLVCARPRRNGYK